MSGPITWGERVTVVVQLHLGHTATGDELRDHTKARLGGVKTPEQVEAWPDLPRSKIGKVLELEIQAQLRRDRS